MMGPETATRPRPSPSPATTRRRCRFCNAALERTFVDLGMSPLANSYVPASQIGEPETFYPLHVFICEKCLLVQLEVLESPEAIFGDYAYFSSYSESWLEHARNYVEDVTRRFDLGPDSRVIEIASNDGYLLQYVVAKGIPALGIEPAANVARAAEEKGIPTLVRFFGEDVARELAGEGRQADLVVGNNVLAHVPALNDFVRGLKIVLKPRGVATMEFPHLLRLVGGNQFDTIYHEHFSYFSFLTVERIFAEHGLTLFDVEELPTHGGSIRVYARHAEDESKPTKPTVGELRGREANRGFDRVECYRSFGERVERTKRKLLSFLIDAKDRGKSIVAYGAAAKGVTLLNYCGIRRDFIDYAVDISPHKQDHYLPGTGILIDHPDRIAETQPDYLLILPWNLKNEIIDKMAHVRDWGGQFVVPIPEVEVCS